MTINTQTLDLGNMILKLVMML